MNNVAASFAGLSTAVSELHRYLLHQLGVQFHNDKQENHVHFQFSPCTFACLHASCTISKAYFQKRMLEVSFPQL